MFQKQVTTDGCKEATFSRAMEGGGEEEWLTDEGTDTGERGRFPEMALSVTKRQLYIALTMWGGWSLETTFPYSGFELAE